MKIEDFKIDQFHFETNCIALCMCFFGIKAWTQIWDTSLMDSNLSLWLSQVSSWACLWNALSLSPQTQQNISKIWDKVSTFESDSRLKSVHETGPWVLQIWLLSFKTHTREERILINLILMLFIIVVFIINHLKVKYHYKIPFCQQSGEI